MEILFGDHTTLSTNKALKESSKIGYLQIYMTLLTDLKRLNDIISYHPLP